MEPVQFSKLLSVFLNLSFKEKKIHFLPISSKINSLNKFNASLKRTVDYRTENTFKVLVAIQTTCTSHRCRTESKNTKKVHTRIPRLVIIRQRG